MKNLIIADSSDIVRKVGRKILSELGFGVTEASTAREAMLACETQLPHVIIVDSGLEGALGLITNIRAMPEGKTVRIFYCVIEADLKHMMQGKRAGASDFLLKPFDRKTLTEVFSDREAA
ncbi:response regulator [Agrobacterium vitis]|uniref:Response regulator n=1 Tax=Agrobacterium vitis TaxID=373 RepID=A0AAE5ATL1_AGRVI|nr:MULTISPECIES: response regulator [Rhizobium/Agrobacterium group]MCF1497893.1 response regulator [Allorhizobium sp. Av2]MCF1470667.1 response regulator [Allorhizobium ampelinum]MCM2438641.1 response regulator [Agrobacterium vitis]MUZ56033.1 response regulator [Agrobacterium vitis]MVA64829.1 response regulator [Agrobacterium vitis]